MTREEKRAYYRDYYRRNPGKQAAATRRYRKAHPEKYRACKKRYKEKHPEKVKAISSRAIKKWAKANKVKLREYDKKYYYRDIEQARAKSRNKAKSRRKNSPEKVHAYDKIRKHARRAMILGCGGTHTHKEWIALCEAHDWLCFYCGTKLTNENISRDHKLPLKRGGRNDIRNIVPACRLCNSSKHTLTAEEFMLRRSVESVHITR